MKVSALATCHNRVNLTMAALDTLYHQQLRQDVELSVCIVDDGSDDGTSNEVRKRFPEVHVLQGSGQLYWAGGMRFGWDNWIREQDFDYLLVFNDDVLLKRDAIMHLVRTAEAYKSGGCGAVAVSGALYDPEMNVPAYGGARKASWWHPLRFKTIEPSHTTLLCDTINMNCTLISRQAIDMIGFLSREYTHGFADYDFGLRLVSAGGKVLLASGYIGTCKINLKQSCDSEDKSLVERLRLINNVKNQPLKERMVFYRRHAGVAWVIYFSLPYIRLVIDSIVRRLVGMVRKHVRKARVY